LQELVRTENDEEVHPNTRNSLASYNINNIMALENTVIQDKLMRLFMQMCFIKQEKDIFSFEIPADKITDCSLFKKNDFTSF
jgi:hypothetical protein